MHKKKKRDDDEKMYDLQDELIDFLEDKAKEMPLADIHAALIVTALSILVQMDGVDLEEAKDFFTKFVLKISDVNILDLNTKDKQKRPERNG